MNPLVSGLAPPPAATVMAGYRQALPLLDLTVGTPWYGPPEAFLAAVRECAQSRGDERTQYDVYAPAQGAAELRDEICRLYRRAYNLTLDPEQILVTHGATGAVWTAILALSGTDDEILLPDPCYTLYEPIVTILGRRPVRVAGSEADNFLLDPETVARAIGPGTALLVLNSPVNPTGAMYDQARLAELVAVTHTAGVHIVHDEVLDCFARRQPHIPVLAVADQGIIAVNSLSKRLGITGWRIGWLAGDPSLVAVATRVHPLTSIAVNHIGQVAGAAALAAPDHDRMVTDRSIQVATAGAAFLESLRTVPGFARGLSLPDGGVYAFVDVRAVPDALTIETGSEPVDVAVTRALRDRYGIATLPGSVFGPSGTGRIRISLAVSPSRLIEAAHRLAGDEANRRSS
jgi:aspartate/methionine/tyrosine aminotransferase